MAHEPPEVLPSDDVTRPGHLDPADVSRLLAAASSRDRHAIDSLFPAVYEQLRALANRQLRNEDVGHTLQPTALVHEAYLRMADQTTVTWQDRAQFFGLAAEMMRRILVNHAEARRTAKRGGGAIRVALDEAVSFVEQRDVDLVALDEALIALAVFDPRQSRIVELRFFAGLTIEETAEVMDVSPATVKREWSVAKAWLHRELAT